MKRLVYIIIFACVSLCAFASLREPPRTISREAAEDLGKLAVEYKGRICPVETMAEDLCIAFCGKKTYKGLTAEQVLAGWLFFYDDWTNEPMLPNSLIVSGKVMRIYNPYSWADDLPLDIPIEEAQFIRGSSGALYYLADTGDERLIPAIQKIAEHQREYYNIDTKRLQAERFYNHFHYTLPVCLICIVLGLILFWLDIVNSPFRGLGGLKTIITFTLFALFAVLTTGLALRWYISGHIPMTNGFETMQFMAWVLLLLALITAKSTSHKSTNHKCLRAFASSRENKQGASLLAAGLTLSVSLMGNHHALITPLPTALQHPLLAFHVSVIMVSYALFFIILIQSIINLTSPIPSQGGESVAVTHGEKVFPSLGGGRGGLLFVAVILLFIGIVLGSIWAKTAWGSYWSWDPKETCALVTLIVYTIPLFKRWLPFLQNEKVYHWYLALAFLSVLFTYFGANFLLPGLHSYAG